MAKLCPIFFCTAFGFIAIGTALGTAQSRLRGKPLQTALFSRSETASECLLDGNNVAVSVRTEMYDAFVKISEALYSKGALQFPRNGFLLAVVRENGFTKWDTDIDMAILDVHCRDFKRAALEVADELPGVRFGNSKDGGEMMCNCSSGWQFHMEGVDVDWPILDGVTWRTDNASVYFHNFVRFTDDTIREKGGGLPLAGFLEMREADLYCFKVKVPLLSEDYLKAYYGPEVFNVAINKCNKPNGPLYLSDPEHCEMNPCYCGAGNMPLALSPGKRARGAITSASCSGFDTEEPYTDEDWKLGNQTLSSETEAADPYWTR